MSRDTRTVDILCPVCQVEKIEVTLTSLDDDPWGIQDIEYRCLCGESKLVDGAKYEDKVYELAMDQVKVGRWTRPGEQP